MRDYFAILWKFSGLCRPALKNKEIYLSLNEDAKKYIAEKGTDLKYGARPLRRAIQKLVELDV